MGEASIDAYRTEKKRIEKVVGEVLGMLFDADPRARVHHYFPVHTYCKPVFFGNRRLYVFQGDTGKPVRRPKTFYPRFFIQGFPGGA